MWVTFVFGEGINKVVHDHVREADVFAGAMFQVISPDGKSVSISPEQEDMHIRAGEADAGSKRNRAAMDKVRAMRIHKVRKTGGTPNAREGDDILMGKLALLQHFVKRSQDRKVPTTRTPCGVVGGEGFFCEWRGCRGCGGFSAHGFRTWFKISRTRYVRPSVLVRLSILGSQYLARRMLASWP